MPSVVHQITTSGPVTRSLTIGALLGAAMLVSPLAARADTVGNAVIQLAQANSPSGSMRNSAAETAAAPRTETVEQRIKTLHSELKITPEEETKWNAVAQAMRENATNMDKIVDQTHASQNQTAVDDLKTYQKFAQAHVDGLKNLISSFTSLYDSMPDAQKKTADQVFESAHQASVSAHGQTG
jgi:hypothetical protein